MSDADFVIKTENLSKVYGWLFWKRKEAALDNLNISIPKGTIFGFLGPNGAGKTTTIRLLMDLIKPSSGSATVLGMPTDDVEVKHRIGFLPDTPAFSTYLSANEFLMVCAKLLKIPAAGRKKRIEDVLEIVKMSKHGKSKLGTFSRGMLQRIGIAQAILNKPDLLILDEPLLGLDPYGRQELKDIILQQRESGTNVFFSSHILSDVEKICDSIGILNKGKLLCCGKIDELLSATGYRVSIASGCNDAVKELMGEATGTVKMADGGWELSFNKSEAVKAKIDLVAERFPKAVTISPSRENLEDYFFRRIEEDEKSQVAASAT